MKNLKNTWVNALVEVLAVFGVMNIVQCYTGLTYNDIRALVWPVYFGIRTGYEMIIRKEEVVLD